MRWKIQQPVRPFFATTEKKVPTAVKNEVSAACVNFVVKNLRFFETVAGNGFIELVKKIIEEPSRCGVLPARELRPHPTTVGRNIEAEVASSNKHCVPVIAGALNEYEWALRWIFGRIQKPTQITLVLPPILSMDEKL